MMPSKIVGVLGVALLLLAADAPITAGGCSFVLPPPLSQQIAQSDSAFLVRWTEGVQGKSSDSGSTNFEVAEVLNRNAASKVQTGSTLKLAPFRPGKAGDWFLLLASPHGESIWAVTPAACDYLKNAPRPDQPSAKRLPFFLRHLESPDEVIRDDALREFDSVPHAAIVEVTKEVPLDTLRSALTKSSDLQGYHGLYGRLLGLRGTAEDAQLLERKILEPTEEF